MNRKSQLLPVNWHVWNVEFIPRVIGQNFEKISVKPVNPDEKNL